MTANEWLEVMKQASDFPQGMEKLILKYGEMLIAEHESKVKKLTIPDVMQQSELLLAFYNYLNGEVFLSKTDGNKYVKKFLSKQ